MRSAFITVAPDESLLGAHRTMRLARLRHVLVASGDVLVGVVSYRDLQELMTLYLERHGGGDRDASLRALAVRDAMVDLPEVVSPDASVAEAAMRLSRLRLGCLPVVESSVDGAHLVGLLTEADLIRFAYETR